MKKTNVIPMTPPTTEDVTLMHVRAFASLRALDRIRDRLELDLKAAKTEWKKKLEAKAAEYLGPIRDEFGADPDAKLTPAQAKRYAAAYQAVVAGLKAHDKMEAEAKADTDSRTGKIKLIEQAIRECVTAASDAMSGQASLPWSPSATTIAGMGWATKGTMDLVYTALLELDQGRTGIDAFQADLLVDLGSAGLTTVDLGKSAAEAIARDVADDDDEPVDEVDDGNLGF